MKEYKKLGEFKKEFQHIECLIQDNLWVVYDKDADHSWMKIVFLEFCQRVCDATESETGVQIIFTVEGPSGSLRECRHTNWGEEGYIFYPNFNHIRACLTWLEKYYDGN